MTILYILHWQDGETAFGSAAKLSQYNCLETIKSHMSGEFNKSQVPNFICCNIHMHFIFFNIKSYLNLSWFLPLSDRYRNISIICSSLVLKIYQSPLLIWNITHSSIVAVHGVIMYIVLDFTDDLSSSSSTLTQLLTKNNFCMDVTSPGMCVKVILKVNLCFSEKQCDTITVNILVILLVFTEKSFIPQILKL